MDAKSSRKCHLWHSGDCTICYAACSNIIEYSSQLSQNRNLSIYRHLFTELDFASAFVIDGPKPENTTGAEVISTLNANLPLLIDKPSAEATFLQQAIDSSPVPKTKHKTLKVRKFWMHHPDVTAALEFRKFYRDHLLVLNKFSLVILFYLNQKQYDHYRKLLPGNLIKGEKLRSLQFRLIHQRKKS